MIRFVVINRPKGTGSRYEIETCKVGGSNPPRLTATTLFKSEVVIRMVNVLTMSAVRRHAIRPVMEVWIASLKSIGAEKSTALRKSGIDQPNNNYTYNRINQRRRCNRQTHR